MKQKAVRNALLGTLVLGVFTGCSTAPPRPSGEVAVAPDVNIGGMPIQGEVVPRQEPASIKGNPDSYVVFGRRYYVMGSSEGYRQRGVASWYGPGFHGRKTSSGTIYNMYGVSAAHKNLPIPTYARVTHLGNGRSIIVRIDDRGPFVGDRLIDLSYGAAVKLGMMGEGTAPVEIEALPPYQYLPGFEAGQMLATSDRSGNVPGPQVESSFTLPAAPSSGTAMIAARSSSPAAAPFTFYPTKAGANPPTVDTGLKTALAPPVRYNGTDTSRAPAITFRPSAPENDLNRAFTATPARSVPPSVALASPGQPGHGDNNPPVATAAPAAKAASAEPAGPADRDSLSFSDRLATVERQPATTTGQPLPAAPTVASTSVDQPRLPASQPPAVFKPSTRPTPVTVTPPAVVLTAVSQPTAQPPAAITPPTTQPPAAITPPAGPTLAAVTPPVGVNNRVITPPPVSSSLSRSSSSPNPLFRQSEAVANAMPTESAEEADTPVRPAASRKLRRPMPDTAADSAKAERLAADNPETRVAKTAGKVAAADKVTTKARATAAVTPEKPTVTAKTSANERIAAATTAKPAAKADKGHADKGQTGNRTVAEADNSHLYLQVGAFAQRGNAEELRNRLVKALRYSVRIDPGRNNLHTVRVGPLNDPVEASRLKVRLASFGISTPHVVFE